MTNTIEIVSLFPKGILETLPEGTVVATINNPEELQLTYDFRYWTDYRGMSGWADGPTDLFKVVGNQIVTTEALDFDAFAGKPFYYELWVSGGQSDDSVIFKIIDVLDVVQGTAGIDILKGDMGQDKIIAGSGDDRLYGNAGNDILYGGMGRDVLSSGSGEDTFMFKFTKESTGANADVITAWDKHTATSIGDTIDVSGIDANSKLAGNQAFSWISSKAFSGKAGELRYERANGDTFVYGDVNGDRKADFTVKIDASVILYKDDFVL